MPDIPQGSVVMHLRCGGIFSGVYYKFTAETDGDRILKISQHFAKLRTKEYSGNLSDSQSFAQPCPAYYHIHRYLTST